MSAKWPTPAGYYSTFRADEALIREHGEPDGGRKVSKPILLSLWHAFVDLANENRAADPYKDDPYRFNATVALIRYRAGGVGRGTFYDALVILDEHLKLVSHTQNRITSPSGKPSFDHSTWCIHPSLPIGKIPCPPHPLSGQPPTPHTGQPTPSVQTPPPPENGADSLISSPRNQQEAGGPPKKRAQEAATSPPPPEARPVNGINWQRAGQAYANTVAYTSGVAFSSFGLRLDPESFEFRIEAREPLSEIEARRLLEAAQRLVATKPELSGFAVRMEARGTPPPPGKESLRRGKCLLGPEDAERAHERSPQKTTPPAALSDE